MAMSWRMKGTVLVACNCAYGCPCNFNALPTSGKCEGSWAWCIDEGEIDGNDVSGLAFMLAVNWPGPIHEGNGVGLLLVDDRANEAVISGIHELVLGGAGGPWDVLGWTWPTLEGPKPVPFRLDLNGLHSSLKAGEEYELVMEPIRNPVSGAEVTPGAVLPQGIVFKSGDFASSAAFKVPGLGFDYSGRYTALAPFDYA